jgi:outer membrane protein assembly factor BamB
MRGALFATVLSLVLAAAGTPASAGVGSGRPLKPATVTHLRPLWTVPAGTVERQITGVAIIGATLLRSSSVFTGDEHATAEIRRYDAFTGADLGPVASAENRAFGRLAVAADALVVQERNPVDGVTMLRSYTLKGTLRWETAAPGEAFVAGDVIVASGGDQVRALEPASGRVRWSVTAEGDSGTSAPVLAGASVLRAGAVGDQGGGSGGRQDQYVLSSLDARTGAVRWRAGASGTEVLVAGGEVITVGAGGTCAFALSTGDRRWCSPPPALHATAAGGAVFVIGEGVVTALSAADGTVRWHRSYALRGWESSTSSWTPVLGGGVLYAAVYHYSPGRHRHELLAVSAAGGRVLRRFDVAMPYEVGGEPLLLTRQAVFFATLANLYAWGAR